MVAGRNRRNSWYPYILRSILPAIHAVCIKEKAYIYVTNGALFAMSPEHMSKRRYLFILMLPFLVLGIAPLGLGLLFHYAPLAVFGVMSIAPCTGDLYMAINVFFQVPVHGKIYLYDIKKIIY